MTELPAGNWGIRGSWHGKISKTQYQTHRTVILCCPICALDTSISHCVISEEGVLTPVFSCPHGCGYKGDLKLVGFSEFMKQLNPPPMGIDS